MCIIAEKTGPETLIKNSHIIPDVYLEPSGTFMMEHFCENSQRLLAGNYFLK